MSKNKLDEWDSKLLSKKVKWIIKYKMNEMNEINHECIIMSENKLNEWDSKLLSEKFKWIIKSKDILNERDQSCVHNYVEK